ncbi:MAG TPA: Nramp family divalent metal transporter [Patescibacteria group bacterium]|nr:Nramp family divalent metal transporter [Patescibacteria group bacterium]
MDKDLKISEHDLPKPLPFSKLVGPSFILLGLGLGSGELILWPYLSSNYGLGIIWGAVLGITMQFFLNMEIERYTLATGESIFTGLRRKFGKLSSYWFLLSTFLPWIWPGIIATSAKLFTAAFGLKYNITFPIILLILIGAILSSGSYLYKTQEKFQKSIIFIGIPFVLLLTFILAKPTDWLSLGKGIFGIGEGFIFLPEGIVMATFLGALAYAGAGGNLNLAQSYYVKEKGYGMGKYSGKITALFSKKTEKLSLTGSLFRQSIENLKLFRLWWKRINLEHLVVFWGTGLLTMLMLSLLAYSTAYKAPGIENGINFLLRESSFISEKTTLFVGTAFVLVAALMLFGTQFSVFASTARIMSENLVLASPKKFSVNKLSKYFYLFLWFQILAGIVIMLLGFNEPLKLVITGAVLNAITMFFYSVMLYILNTKSLPYAIRPTTFRRAMILGGIFLYGGFSLFTLIKNL